MHALADIQIPRLPKVGYVLKKYPRLSETFILDEVLGVEAAGAEVSIFSLRLPDDGRFHADLAAVRAEVSYLPGFGATTVLDAFDALAGLGPHADEVLPDLVAFARRLGPAGPGVLVQGVHLAHQAVAAGVEHLHAHFMTVAAHTAYIAHMLTGLPFTVTAHAKDIYRRTVDADLFHTVASAAAAVITVCDANKAHLERHLADGAGAVRRIYNGIDVGAAPPPALREPGLVLAAGRLVEKKGLTVLLDAARLLADGGTPFRLVVVGDGEERANLEAQSARLGLVDRVTFVGAAPRHEVQALMGRAEVLAAPCLVGDDGNRDALPTVLLEALADALPAVTTPVTGIPEIIEDGVEGLIVPEGDPVALAAALRRALSDKELLAEMSAAGPRKAAMRFDRGRTIRQLLAVFCGADPLLARSA